MKRFLRALPIILMVIIALAIIITNRNLSVEQIISYTPENKISSALFLIAIYALKSFTIVVPIDVLSVAGGVMFSWFWGSLINLLGVFVSITVSYFIGRFSGAQMSEQLIKKYPKLAKFREMRKNNDFFFSFIIRALGIFPCDIVGMYMGSVKIDYKTYITGGMLGFAPSIILVTLLGTHLENFNSPILYIVLGFNLVFSGVCLIIHRIMRKRKNERI